MDRNPLHGALISDDDDDDGGGGDADGADGAKVHSFWHNAFMQSEHIHFNCPCFYSIDVVECTQS